MLKYLPVELQNSIKYYLIEHPIATIIKHSQDEMIEKMWDYEEDNIMDLVEQRIIMHKIITAYLYAKNNGNTSNELLTTIFNEYKIQNGYTR